MIHPASEAMTNKLATLIAEILTKDLTPSDFSPDVELVKLGMTSVHMVQLMLAVEADFDVTIPPADITLENFKSMASIERLINRLSSTTSRIGIVAT